MYKVLKKAVGLVFLVCVSPAIAGGHLSEEQLTKAQALLDANNIEAKIAIRQFINYRNGGGVVSGYALHDGLPVFNSELTFHFGPGGEAVRMPGGMAYQMGQAVDLADFAIDHDALISEAEATTALEEEATSALVKAGPDFDRGDAHRVAVCADRKGGYDSELGILGGAPVWHVNCPGSRTVGVFVHGYEGTIVEREADAPPAPLPISVPGVETGSN